MQQLTCSNISVNIGEAMEARTSDALWFLARQWQTGEFAAENGGRPAYLSFEWQDHPLVSAKVGQASRAITPDQPLESLVEPEGATGESPAWRSAALEYAFAVESDSHTLQAQEYPGRNLDWYHFDVAKPKIAAAPATQVRRMTPTQLYVRGAPHPRWWRFEDTDAAFDAGVDPEPNVLSMLLPEFFYLDINNWYLAPLPATTGTIREMTMVTVVDSFEVTNTLNPVSGGSDKTWRVFTLDPAEGQASAAFDGHHLFMPNVALDVLHNDDIEDVRFLRDEEANLVWANEHRYQLADGTAVVNGETGGPAMLSAPTGDGLPRFVLRSDTEPHQVPYVPRFISPQSVTDGEIYLRRARSLESATQANPQYRSRIVSETWRLNEEEVPRSGVRVRRIERFARGSDGKGYFWIGRQKETGRAMVHPDLRFDYLEAVPSGDT